MDFLKKIVDAAKLMPQDPLINRVFFALNHYISTGDHVGEGVAYEVQDHRIMFMVLHRPEVEDDLADWQRLDARLGEIGAEYRRLNPQRRPLFELQDLGTIPAVTPQEPGDHFLGIGIIVAYKNLIEFSALLRERPGPLGWGSFYPTISQIEWHEPQAPDQN